MLLVRRSCAVTLGVSVAHGGGATSSGVLGKKRFCAQSATFTRPMSTGTSTSGPMTAANAAPLWMPKRRDGDGDGELEVVRRRRERERRRLLVVGARRACS